MSFKQNYFSGLSGLVLDRPKYLFPEPFQNSSRLTYYSTIFNSIEINSSFYKIPLPSTVEKWHDSVHENFKFTFKLFKEITHCKGLSFHEEFIPKLFSAINCVKEKQGCLLVQFPPGLGVEYEAQFGKLLQHIQMKNSACWNVAVEFRNKSWYRENIFELLNYFNTALVVHDMPGSSTPAMDQKADFIYLRFHGPTGNYRDSYSEGFLQEYVSYINEWIKAEKSVYVYFNNTAGDAFNNLKKLNEFVYSHNEIPL
jgi:uncharacterized protein YecE (DUF72 family)